MGILPAVPAHAEFGASFTVSSGDTTTGPNVAIDGKGRATAVWQVDEGPGLQIEVATFSASNGGAHLAYASSPFSSAYSPSVAVNAKGDAAIIWEGSGVLARTRSAAGLFGPIRTLSDVPISAYENVGAAVGPTGNVTTVWNLIQFHQNVNRNQARRISAAGALGPLTNLSVPVSNDPQVAVDGKGNALFAWSRTKGQSIQIEARTLSAAGALGPVQVISLPGGIALDPQLAMTDQGSAIFVWVRRDATGKRLVRIEARTRSAAGTLGALQVLADVTSKPPAVEVSSPKVAIDRQGNVAFAWAYYDGRYQRIQVRTRSAAGALAPIKTISGIGQDADEPLIAFTKTGKAEVVWESFRWSDATRRILARSLSTTGQVGLTQVLSRDGGRPALAGNASGRTVAVWTEHVEDFTWLLQAAIAN